MTPYTHTASHIADYYPFGMEIQRGGTFNPTPPAGNLLNNRYLYNSKEFQDDFGLNWYDYGARFYDPQIARFHTVDPLTEKNHRNTPYSYAANSPINYIDFLGLDSLQRATAISQMHAHIANQTPYDFNVYYSILPLGNSPGAPGNCSSSVANCIVEAGEPNPTRAPEVGCQGAGVLNIEANTERVNDIMDVQEGNIITFRISEGGHGYHTGLITEIISENGNINITFGHISSGGNGYESFTIGDNSNWDSRTYGFYKWDTKPDRVAGNNPSITNSGQSNRQSGQNQNNQNGFIQRGARVLNNIERRITNALRVPF